MNKEPEKPFYLQSPSDLQDLIEYLKQLSPSPSKKHPWTVKVSQDDEDRSLKQNRLAFLWYRIRGSELGHSRHYERALCKFLFAIPILREHKDFNKFSETALNHMSYQQKLDAMEFVPVTRLMNVKEFAEFLNTVEQESTASGIMLPRPSDVYDDALLIEAEARGY